MDSSTIKYLESCGALVYCINTHRYLFLLRSGAKHAGSWGLVGGKLEAGETVAQALLREIAEEIGDVIPDPKLIPIEKFTSENKNFIYHTFLITVAEEFVPILNDEHSGYAWVPLQEHPKPLHPGVWRTFNFKSVIEKLHTIETVKDQLLVQTV
jgi:8-oxo-dGTP pyrophosphatase MutT (NUDIX family)